MKIYIVLACVLLTAGWAAADETVIGVTYSHRQLPSGIPPDTSIVEGSILATFTSNNPVDLLEPDSSVIKISDTEYTYTFVWNWLGAKAVDFIDEANDTIPVVAWPEPVYPFDPTAHDVPVIHIRTDSCSLWDPDSGIYVWGNNSNFAQRGSEWERVTTADYYDTGGVPAFSEEAGLRINGQSTRYLSQKGLRLYFDDYGTSDQVDYDFFGCAPTSFRRLLLRTCYYPKYLLNSNLVEQIFRDLGHLGNRYACVVVYINSEYWGCYSLRERYDEEFVEHTHDLANDDYILIKDGETIHGAGDEWWDFLASFAGPQDLTSHDWFMDVDSKLDLLSYIDWLFINIYSAATDNGFASNLALLKVKDGKWKFLMWDEDDLFVPVNLPATHFRLYAAEDSAEFNMFLPPHPGGLIWSPSKQEWCTMFNSFMHNSEFKALFSDRVDTLLAGKMSADSLTARVNSLVAVQGPEMTMHAERWNWYSPQAYSNAASALTQWLTDRRPIILTQKDAFMDHFRVPVELSRFEVAGGSGYADLSWRTESETGNQGFVVYRSLDTPENMVEIASYLTHPELVGQLDSSTPTEYGFVDSSYAGNHVNYYQLHHVDIYDSVTAHNWIEYVWPTSWTGLVLNEMMADNDHTIHDRFLEFDDWFELYNGGEDTVFLDNLGLTDNLDNPAKHRMVGGLSIPPGGYLLLWADNDLEQGPKHCAFNLDIDGEELAIFRPDGTTIIDSVTFGEQLSEIGYARYPDGDSAWSYSYFATPGTTNVVPGTELILVLNEFMADNESIILDEASEYDPWLELYNPLPVGLGLDGLTLTDDPLQPTEWAFPDTSISPKGYLLVWVDGEPGDGPLHTSFGTEPTGGLLGFYYTDGSTPIDALSFGIQFPDISLARVPDGTSGWHPTTNPTPGSQNQSSEAPPELYINEFLASNDTVIQDENGDFDDWVEIFNPGPDTVEMGGLFLTDNLSDQMKWEFPDIMIGPGEFLLVWCDDDNDGPLHTTFKLDADGEEIGLFWRIDQGNPVIDSYIFGSQTTDVSEGRQWDGGPDWVFFTAPTPADSNGCPGAVVADPDLGWDMVRSYPTPFKVGTTLQFNLPEKAHVRLGVFDTRGRLVTRLAEGDLSSGIHDVPWNGTDRFGARVSSGVYFFRLETDRRVYLRKTVLLQ